MADIEQLIKDGIIGATVGAVADITLHGGIPIETAAAIGAVAADTIDLLKDSESPNIPTTKRREYPNTTNDELLKFNARHNAQSQSNSNYGGTEGGGFNRVHVFHHNGDKENETHAPFPQGEDRNFFAFSEPSNYAERVEYEPFAKTSESCRTESCKTANYATTCDKELQKVTNSNITPPPEVQASILKWKDKSPSKPCQKHEVEMPANACYSCGSGGGMCDHLAKYDGTHKSTHCVYPETRAEVATVSKRIGKPIKEHRNVNRTHLTGIERDNLLGLVNNTSVDDKEALRQELTDHIDPSLTYGENKTALQDYLASVTPLNTNITAHEVMDYEARINTIAPEEVEQANDPFLLESLRERATQGDSSASMQLELMQIKQDGFAQMGISAPAPEMETAQNIDSIISRGINEIPAPFIAGAPMPEAPPIDPAMDWCSSTPETLKFSETFVPPPPEVINESCLSQPQATASPEMRNQYIL